MISIYKISPLSTQRKGWLVRGRECLVGLSILLVYYLISPLRNLNHSKCGTVLAFKTVDGHRKEVRQPLYRKILKQNNAMPQHFSCKFYQQDFVSVTDCVHICESAECMGKWGKVTVF